MPKANSGKTSAGAGKRIDDKVKNWLNNTSNRGKYIVATIIVVLMLAIIVFVAIHLTKTVSSFSELSEETTKSLVGLLTRVL